MVGHPSRVDKRLCGRGRIKFRNIHPFLTCDQQQILARRLYCLPNQSFSMFSTFLRHRSIILNWSLLLLVLSLQKNICRLLPTVAKKFNALTGLIGLIGFVPLLSLTAVADIWLLELVNITATKSQSKARRGNTSCVSFKTLRWNLPTQQHQTTYSL